MAEHTYKFNVTMTCGGCSGAVERVLKKLDGIHASPSPAPQRPLYRARVLTDEQVSSPSMSPWTRRRPTS